MSFGIWLLYSLATEVSLSSFHLSAASPTMCVLYMTDWLGRRLRIFIKVCFISSPVELPHYFQMSVLVTHVSKDG